MAATADIPIIDISGDQDVVAQQLVGAAQEHGFIYIKNLGRDISSSSIDGAFALVRPSSYQNFGKGLFLLPLLINALYVLYIVQESIRCPCRRKAGLHHQYK